LPEQLDQSMSEQTCWRWGGKDYGWFVGIPGVLVVEHWCSGEKPDPALWGHNLP
jgi:hypothetical protein